MSKSYRKLYCSLTVAGEAKGSKSDKQRSNRKIRRSNKRSTSKISSAESAEDVAPSFKTKKSVEKYDFRGEGCTTKVDPKNPGNFHIKRLPGGRTTARTRMVK